MSIITFSVNDSVQEWIFKLNKIFGQEVVNGAFNEQKSNYDDTVFVVSGGNIRSGSDIISIPGASLTLDTGFEYVVGIDLNNNILDYVLSTEPLESFVPLFIVTTNNTRIVKVRDTRTWLSVTSEVLVSDAINELKNEADPFPQYTKETRTDQLELDIDNKVDKDNVGNEIIITSTGTQTVSEALDRRGVKFTALRAPTSGAFDPEDYLETATKVTEGLDCYTLGYRQKGDGGGNDYTLVAAGTGTDDGGSFIDLAGSGLQARMLVSVNINIRQFGAKGDGSDDSFAFQSAINYMGFVNKTPNGYKGFYGGCLHIPLGSFVVKSKVSYYETTNRDVNFKIQGVSPKESKIYVANNDGFLDIEKTNYGLYFHCYDLGIFASNSSYHGLSGQHSGTAIFLKQYHSGNRRDNHVIFKNVLVGPEYGLAPVDDHFQYGVRVHGGGRMHTDGLRVWGLNSFQRERSDTWVGEIGIDIFNHYGPSINGGGAWGFKKGLSYDADVDPGPEGGNFVGGAYDSEVGVYIRTPSIAGEPGLYMNKVHCNAGTVGIHIIGKRYAKIHDCLLYNETESSRGPFTDILLDRVGQSEITETTFAFIENVDRTNVLVKGNCDRIHLNQNRHNTAGTGVKLENGCETIYVNDPFFDNNLDTHIDDEGALDLNVNFAKDVGFMASLASPLSIANDSPVTISWDNTVYDNGWAETAPYQAIVVPNGKGIRRIIITVHMRWAVDSNGYRSVYITKNNSVAYEGFVSVRKQASGRTNSVVSTPVIEVSDGDIFRVQCRQDSGAPIDLDSGSSIQIRTV